MGPKLEVAPYSPTTEVELAPYNRFEHDEEPEEEDDELADWALTSNHNLAHMMAWLSSIVFIGSTVAYIDECAQAYGIVTAGSAVWSPYIAVLISLIGLFCQARLASIPFRRRIQRPVIQRYRVDGFRAMARVIKRKQKKSPSHRVTLGYRPNRRDRKAIYVKEFFIGDEDLFEHDFPVVIIPGIPTSAIMAYTFDKITDPERERKVYRYGILAPMLWGLATGSGIGVELLNQSDSWAQWGLLWLFGISVISSLCWGYIMTVSETKEWLHGDSLPIEDWKEENPSMINCDSCRTLECLDMV